METKRLVLAIVLSCLLFLGWQVLATHMGWVPTAPETAQSNATSGTSANNSTLPSPPPAPSTQPAVEPTAPRFVQQGESIVVETPLYRAVLGSNGGVIREFELLKFKKTIDADGGFMNLIGQAAAAMGPLGIYANGVPSWVEGTWQVEGEPLSLKAGETGKLAFIGQVKDMTIRRELTFSADGYTIGDTTSITPDSAKNISFYFSLGSSKLTALESPGVGARIWAAIFGGEKPAPQESQLNITRVAWLENGSFKEETSTSALQEKSGSGKEINGNLSWIGVMNNYFISAIAMSDPDSNAIANYSNGVFHVTLGRPTIEASPEKPAVLSVSYYMGPKETKSLASAPDGLSSAIDYGWLTILAKPLVLLLQFFYSFTGNYGVAIILMTVVVKLVLWPLSLKGYRSMEQMRKIQPLMQELREKHAGDKEKMNTEMMALYKRHKVNPAGGCLPILVQIPVFFALYRVLLYSIELRHAAFIPYLPFTDKPWLMDLAAQDPYLITPLVMGATMFIQQKLTPAPGDPTQAKIMLFMPLIFTVLFITFPAGLVLYWLTNNVISIGQQWWQMKRSAKA